MRVNKHLNNLKITKMIYAIKNFEERYIQEYGQKKQRKVSNLIATSKKLTENFTNPRYHGIVPNHNDYFNYVYSVGYFLSSNKATKILAGLLAINRWNNDINQPQGICDNEVLESISKRLIYKIDNNGTNYPRDEYVW